jgi:hypothetical protein
MEIAAVWASFAYHAAQRDQMLPRRPLPPEPPAEAKPAEPGKPAAAKPTAPPK